MVAYALITGMISGPVNSEVKTSLPFRMVMRIFNKDSIVESGVDVASRASRIFVLAVLVAKVVASTHLGSKEYEKFFQLQSYIVGTSVRLFPHTWLSCGCCQ